MKWGEIIKKSFGYLKEYRALWYLGILAALTEGGVSGGSFNGAGGSSNFSTGSSDHLQSTVTKASNWMSANSFEVGILLLAFFLISLIILYVSYSARAGLIGAVDDLESGKEKISTHEAFENGRKYFWRLLGLTILIALIIAAAILVLVGLILALVAIAIATTPWLLLILIPLGLIFIVGVFVLSVYASLLVLLSTRQIIIKNSGIVASLHEASEIIGKNTSNLIIAWLINTAFGIAFGIAVAIAVLIVGGILVLLGVGIYFASSILGLLIYAIPFGLAFLALLLLMGGVVNAYFSTYWTIVYRRLVQSS